MEPKKKKNVIHFKDKKKDDSLAKSMAYAGIGSGAAKFTNTALLGAIMARQASLPKLEDHNLHELETHYGLNGKIKYNTESPHFGAYESNALKKALLKGVRGVSKRLSPEHVDGLTEQINELEKTQGTIHTTEGLGDRPGIVAHELGHAAIEREGGALGFAQDYLRPITGSYPGQLAAGMGAYKATDKEKDPSKGALEGGLVGAAVNSPTLATEYGASHKAWKALGHTSLSPELVGKNRFGLIPPFLTYLGATTLPYAAVGGIHAYNNSKTKNNMNQPQLKEAYYRGFIKEAIHHGHDEESASGLMTDLINDKTLGPYSKSMLANPLRTQQLLQLMRMNKETHPGQYYLNPAVPGPISKLMTEVGNENNKFMNKINPFISRKGKEMYG